jgi:hypothetical protein
MQRPNRRNRGLPPLPVAIQNEPPRNTAEHDFLQRLRIKLQQFPSKSDAISHEPQTRPNPRIPLHHNRPLKILRPIAKQIDHPAVNGEPVLTPTGSSASGAFTRLFESIRMLEPMPHGSGNTTAPEMQAREKGTNCPESRTNRPDLEIQTGCERHFGARGEKRAFDAFPTLQKTNSR